MGRWKAVSEGVELDYGDIDELDFFSDGTYSSNLTNYSGGYSVDENRLKISGILDEALTFTFELDGDTVIIYEENGDTVEYNRVDN